MGSQATCDHEGRTSARWSQYPFHRDELARSATGTLRQAIRKTWRYVEQDQRAATHVVCRSHELPRLRGKSIPPVVIKLRLCTGSASPAGPPGWYGIGMCASEHDSFEAVQSCRPRNRIGKASRIPLGIFVSLPGDLPSNREVRSSSAWMIWGQSETLSTPWGKGGPARSPPQMTPTSTAQQAVR